MIETKLERWENILDTETVDTIHEKLNEAMELFGEISQDEIDEAEKKFAWIIEQAPEVFRETIEDTYAEENIMYLMESITVGLKSFVKMSKYMSTLNDSYRMELERKIQEAYTKIMIKFIIEYVD